MNIKKICDKIITLYEHTEKEKQEGYLTIKLVYEIRDEIDKDKFTDKDLKPILETAKRIALTKKNLKQLLEDELLKTISYLPYKLWREQEGEEKKHFERSTKTKEGKIAEALIKFAQEIYIIKLDRDAFSGKRRGYALDILQSVSDYFEVPEFMELCTKSIKSKSKNEFLAATESLKLYYAERKDELLSEDIISAVEKRVDKTKDRVELIGGLTLLVDTGVISEFEALSKRDEWRERTDSW